MDDQEGTQSVFTVTPEGTAQRRVVTVVRTDARHAEVTQASGLKAGDTVVTQGRKNVQDGAKLELANGKGMAHVAH